MNPRFASIALAVLLGTPGLAQTRITAVRFWSLGDVTRVAIETSAEAKYRSDRLDKPDRIFFDLEGVSPQSRGLETIPVGDRLLKQIRIARPQPGVARVVLDLAGPAEYSVSQLTNPHRIMVEVRLPGTAPATPPVRSVTGSHTIEEELPAEPKPEPVKLEPVKPETRKDPPGKPKPDQAAPRTDPPVQLAAAVPKTAPPRVPEAKPAATPRPVEPRPAEATRVEPKPFELPRPVEVKPAGMPRLIEPKPAEATRVEPKPAAEAVVPKMAPPLPAEPKPFEATRVEPKLVAEAKPSEPPRPAQTEPKRSPETALAAKRDSHGDRSLIRALGLKLGRVVLDPGHGGHDTGSIGPGGLMEKDLVLDVAKRLGALIAQRLGSEVVYTRSDDTFVPLEERTGIANEKAADLFLSIHANSSRLDGISGPETFYLNFTTSASALEVAARENASSEKSIHELQSLLQKIALKEKVQESREFAASVQKSLFSGLARGRAIKNRGVKQAPFVVLIGAQMPSVLAEIAFISNARDELMLKRTDYRQRVAESLFKGVSQYANSLSHFYVAQGKGSPVQP